jgi:hypothetical protein
MKTTMNMNNAAMNTAINTILENIGNNPEAMKALMSAIAETGKIANETKTEQVKKTCRYVICLERVTVNGDKVYHPVVMTPPTCENPRMLIVDNAVEAQDKAQSFGMMIHDNVYAMPATEKQIDKLYGLLKECNEHIVNAINTAVEAVGMITANIDRDALCAQYMQQMMANCHCIIGSSMTENSEIIEEDIEVIHPDRIVESCDNNDCEDDEWDEDDCDDDCDYCDCECCPNHPNNN